MTDPFSKVDPSWLKYLQPQSSEILAKLGSEVISPRFEDIFSAFNYPIERYRVVIIGQDPYPTSGLANGLAFSVHSQVEKLPPSLRNIFREYSEDLGLPLPKNGDLSKWSSAGVLLLNRHLTISEGMSASHLDIGWARITESIARELGKRDVVAILWGRHAQELRSHFKYVIEGVHPSPLSAYRGFFGSKPFSRTNRILLDIDKDPIDWNLG